MSFGLLSSIIPQVNVNTLLYKEASDKLAVGRISISSKNYSPSKIRIGISSGSEDVNYIVYNKILNYGETIETGDIYVGSNQELIVRSTESDVNFLFYGENFTDELNPVKSGFLSSVSSSNLQKKVLFTSPQNYNSTVNISVCNLDSIPGKARIGISSGTFGSKDYFEYDVELNTNDPYIRSNIKLGPGQSIICSSSANSNVSFVCHGKISIVPLDYEVVYDDLQILGNLSVSGNSIVSGVVTATSFYGNGSTLSNVNRVSIFENGQLSGVATSINFKDNINVDFNSGIATVSTTDNFNVKTNLTVNNDKFSVSGSNGNTNVSGTLNVGSNAVISGNVNLLNNKVINVGSATSSTDATNKSYVDTRSIAMSIALS